jgi:hypothetical protein
MVEHDPAALSTTMALAYPKRVCDVGWGLARDFAFAYEEISSYLMVANPASHQTGWSPTAASMRLNR